MWTNDIKTKAKPSYLTFKLTNQPTNNAMVSLKDGVTVWGQSQKEDFLSKIY